MNGVKSIFRSGFFKVFIICLLGGLAFVVIGAIEVADSKKTPIDINTLTKDDIKAGVIVEGDIYYNFGVCETIESKRNGKTESTSYRYVVPLVDDTMFTVNVNDGSSNASLIADFDRQTDETYDLLDGNIEDTTTVVHVKGKINKMGNEDYGYYKDFLKSGDYTDDEISTYGSEYYLVIKDFSEGPLIMIFGLVFVGIAVLIGFLSIRKSKKAAANATPAGTFPSQNSFAQAGMGQQGGMPQPGMPQPGMQQMNPQQGQFAQQPQQFTQQPQQFAQQPDQFAQQAPQGYQQNNDPYSMQ